MSDCENYGCAWSVIRVYTCSAVSNNRLLTEVDVECHRCKAQRYVVSCGNVLEDGEEIK